MHKPWILTNGLWRTVPFPIFPWGVNALGTMQFAFFFLPGTISGTPTATSTRLLSILAALVVIAVDVWWRATGYERPAWIRAVLPTEGGSLAFLPGWLMGLAVIALRVFMMATTPAR